MNKVDRTLQRLTAELNRLPVDAFENLAVKRCARAYALAACEGKLSRLPDAGWRASMAFRGSMPPLSGSGNVRDFIACTTYGMLLGIIEPEEATKLLYAAQVAHTTRRTYSRSKSKSETGSDSKTNIRSKSKNNAKNTVQDANSPAK